MDDETMDLTHKISEIFRTAKPGRVIADIVDFIIDRDKNKWFEKKEHPRAL
jgi:hypothetical protein